MQSDKNSHTNQDFLGVSLVPTRGAIHHIIVPFFDTGFKLIKFVVGIPQELIDRAEALAKQFFALPDAVKRAYHIPGGGGARVGGCGPERGGSERGR